MKKISMYFMFVFYLFQASVDAEVQLINGNPHDIFKFVSPYLSKNPVIVEAGAYDGSESISMAKYWPKGKVYCFEPFPQIFKQLAVRTARYANIKAYQIALADISGKLPFYLGHFKDNNPSASSSLLPAKEHRDFVHSIVFDEWIEVEAISIDDWAKLEKIHYIDFMWLDMQGYELNTLKASHLISNIGAIYMEVTFIEAYEGQYTYGDVKNWMQENGFELIALDFDESIPLTQRHLIKPNGNLPFYGNALFLNKKLL